MAGRWSVRLWRDICCGTSGEKADIATIVAMAGHKRRSVGIKELKDRASEIVATVQRTGQTISITKNNQEVARIIPIPQSPHERLIAAGLLRPGAQPPPLAGLKLEGPAIDGSPAIAAILEDRGEH